MPLPFWAMRLHHLVVEIAAAEAEHRQEDAGLALLLDQALQILVVGLADIEVAVGRQHDAVDAVLDEGLLGKPVGLAGCRPRRRSSRPASDVSIADRIFARSDTLVGISTVPALPA